MIAIRKSENHSGCPELDFLNIHIYEIIDQKLWPYLEYEKIFQNISRITCLNYVHVDNPPPPGQKHCHCLFCQKS